MSDSNYIGNELEIFKEAINWKNYWLNSVKKYINGDVLEVGAGIGVNTNLILNNCNNLISLTAIEPDKVLADKILEDIKVNKDQLEVKSCYLKDMPTSKKYDTILYIDVIEHIKDDKEELEVAKTYLKEGGHLIILVPAHNYLFSSFDEAIGHYRRYNKSLLNNAVPKDLNKVRVFYLDFFGLSASLANKLFLKQSYPTRAQILKWDRIIVPLSKLADKIIFHSLGKSLVGVWKRN